MIQLTRLNGDRFVINAELIRTVEARPDTFVTLTNGDQFIVCEPPAVVVSRSLSWASAVRRASLT